MEKQDILENLMELLEQNEIEVRSDFIGDLAAGLCVIKGKKVFFIDKNAQTADVLATCARVVHENIDIDNIYLKPQVRQFLEKNRPE
jgi:hypothetical protein